MECIPALVLVVLGAARVLVVTSITMGLTTAFGDAMTLMWSLAQVSGSTLFSLHLSWTCDQISCCYDGVIDDKTVKLWDVSTEKCVRTFTGHRGFVFSVQQHYATGLLVSGSFDNTVI